jgi:hypothetical protein
MGIPYPGRIQSHDPFDFYFEVKLKKVKKMLVHRYTIPWQDSISRPICFQTVPLDLRRQGLNEKKKR